MFSVTQETSDESEVSTRTKNRSEFGGRPSIVSIFNGVVDEGVKFIKQNGFAAQIKRRTEVGFWNGVNINETQSHLYKTFFCYEIAYNILNNNNASFSSSK